MRNPPGHAGINEQEDEQEQGPATHWDWRRPGEEESHQLEQG